MLIWSFHLFYFVCRWVGGGCCLGLQSLYVLSTQSTMCMHVVRQGNKVLSLSLQVTTKYIILAIFPLMDDFSLSGKDHFTLFQKHNMQTCKALCFLMFQIFRSDISNQFLSFHSETARLDYHSTDHYSSFILLLIKKSKIKKIISFSHGQHFYN